MRRTRGVTLVDVAVAHWLNHGTHFPIPDDHPYADDVERALDFREFVERRWRASKACFAGIPLREWARDGRTRGALEPTIGRWLRGEPQRRMPEFWP